MSNTFTTTVYTDESGQFLFPPYGQSGNTRSWAQAVGFEPSRTDADLTVGAKKQVDLTLASLADFHKQLSGTEWAASLPEDSPEDRRMKTVFINNCSGCHQVSFLLQNRFDAAGWGAVITLMEKMLSIGYAPVDATPNSVIHAYKLELAEYLGRVRGPGNSGAQLETASTALPATRPRLWSPSMICRGRHAGLDHGTQRYGLVGGHAFPLERPSCARRGGRQRRICLVCG